MEEISNHEQLRATKKSTVEGLRKALLIVRNPDAQGAGESCFGVVFWVGFCVGRGYLFGLSVCVAG